MFPLQDMNTNVGNEVEPHENLTSVLDEVMGQLHTWVALDPGKLPPANPE
jgi:hypothetical protein